MDRVKVIAELSKREAQEQELLLTAAVDELLNESHSDSVDPAIQVLQEILINASKQGVTNDELNSFFKEVGLQISVREEACVSIRKMLTERDESSSSLSTFEHLDWRLQAELFKSHMFAKYSPEVMLKFSFEGQQEKKVVRCDIPCLLRLKGVVEEALSESKDPSLQKVLRQLR